MRTVTSETITRTVKNLCLRANKFLPSDIKLTLDTALDYEISPNGKRAIHSIQSKTTRCPSTQAFRSVRTPAWWSYLPRSVRMSTL